MQVGAFYVLENMKVKNIVIGVQAEKYQNCTEFIEVAKKKNVKVIVLKAGDTLDIDKETSFETIFPEPKNTISENMINNNSLVLKLIYKNFSMLFTGDIEEKAENYIANKCKETLKADIIKVAHHGSKTSSTAKFIEYVKPKIALIGVSENNNFGHPNGEVLERLKKYNIQIFRTDKSGEVSISTDGSKIICKPLID